jgi:hypothetical protein
LLVGTSPLRADKVSDHRAAGCDTRDPLANSAAGGFFLCEKIACGDFFDTALPSPPAKSVVFAGGASA